MDPSFSFSEIASSIVLLHLLFMPLLVLLCFLFVLLLFCRAHCLPVPSHNLHLLGHAKFRRLLGSLVLGRSISNIFSSVTVVGSFELLGLDLAPARVDRCRSFGYFDHSLLASILEDFEFGLDLLHWLLS